MKLKAVLLALFLKCIYVESKLPQYFVSYSSGLSEEVSSTPPPEYQNEGNPQERIIGLGMRSFDDKDEEYNYGERLTETTKKPCAVVVLSNIQNPNMQSLLRKYRYDAQGILIPSSVKYFIKMPQQGIHSAPILVPLNDKAFSPLGGFVRYYKEVPPIPQAWRR